MIPFVAAYFKPSIVDFNLEKYPSRSSRFHMESLQSYGAKWRLFVS
jgi:hypothetical protein